ncbi:MAG: DPP IV N-terminal domain-containing protein [Pirellulaceae bacterium]
MFQTACYNFLAACSLTTKSIRNASTVLALLACLTTPAAAQETSNAVAETNSNTEPAEGTPAAMPSAEAIKSISEMVTVAEQSEFVDSANIQELEVYLRKLASNWPVAELTTIGLTVEGRPLWALTVEPTVEVPYEPLTVLLLGGIHSGECDGKEALLALARDMASGKQGDWWKSLRLVFVPNFNADGNERRGVDHRPGQTGPDDGMGIRENAQGLDLNRDFIKLDSPEVRSLVATMNRYDVDMLIDTHTTNGSLHQYQLTYDIPHNPASPPRIRKWLRELLMPRVTMKMKEAGFETTYYGNFDRDHRKWSTYGHEPRYSTEYTGLRGKIGILSESYSYATYKTRVEASYHFVEEVMKGLVDDAANVRRIIDAAANENKSGTEMPLQAKIVKTADGVIAKGYVRPDGTPPTGPYSFDSFAEHEKKDYEVQLWNTAQATVSVNLPTAYVIPPQNAWAASRLLRHGVRLTRLTKPLTVAADVYTFSEVEKSREFQRHTMLSAKTNLQSAERVLAEGSWVVTTDQPLGRLAAHLLEPSADDSLVTWNFFDPDVEADKEYPVLRLNKPLPEGSVEPTTDIVPAEKISLERLFDPERSVNYGGDRARPPRWLKNSNEYLITGGYGRTYAVDAATGSRRRLTELDSLRGKLEDLEAFSSQQARDAASIGVFTDDWAHALLTHENDLYYFNSEKDSVRQLTESSEEREQLADLSPTGEKVAFVRDNNLWVVDCESSELKQLTQDGSEQLLNGILDWVYQEELYGRGNFKGFWWSPDGKQIAMLQLDQTPVPTYQVSDSISFGQTLEATRYPKAGEPIPTARVWLVDVASGELQQVDLGNWPENDRLVGRVSWAPDGELWLQVFNRVQNQQDLVHVDPATGDTETLFTEVSPGWIEIRTTPQFLPTGDFLWLSDLPEGRTHLFRVSTENGKKTQLTSGDWDVADLLTVSLDKRYAFVSGNISSPIESQLLRVDLASGDVTQVTAAPGSHRASVSASGEYFIDVFSSADSQPFASLNSIDGQLLRVLAAPISDRHQFVDIQRPKLFTIPARDGVELQSQLMLPPGFDPEKPDRKLPVVFYVYGGPQAPTVNNAWEGRSFWWHQMLCQQGFAVLLCDNRSARGRGVKDTWTIRGDMCRVELQDLEDAVSWLGEQSWADVDRVGIWGWSYGGYFTSYALTHSKSFKCGIAGAPVTDWRNYDAVYTERYMDLPQDNEAGYKSSSVVEAAENLSGSLLIIHGERDDNVHMSNTLQLTYALQKAGKQFQLMIYPKNRHGIVDRDQRYHMHRMMTDFFKRELQP